MIGTDGARNVLHHDGLADSRRRHDQAALSHALRRYDVNDPAGLVFDGRILELHIEPARRVKRRQIVEMNLVLDFLRILEIDRGNLEQRKIALTVLGSADRPLDGIAGAKAEAADLRWADIDVVRTCEIVGLRRTQKAEAILQRFDDARSGDLDIAFGEFLQDREQHVLLAHGRSVFDLELFGERKQVGGGLGLQFLQVHRLQAVLYCHFGLHLENMGEVTRLSEDTFRCLRLHGRRFGQHAPV